MADDFSSDEQRQLMRWLIAVMGVLGGMFVALRLFVVAHAPPASLAGWNGILVALPLIVARVLRWRLADRTVRA